MICIPPRQMLSKFWKRYRTTLGSTVSRLIGIDRPLACFQIHRVAMELAPYPAKLVPGLLILSDDAKRPLVIGHCVVECNSMMFDFAFTGPASYGLATHTSYEFLPCELEPEKQFEDLPKHVVDNLNHGIEKAEEWWRSLDCVDKKSLMCAVQCCASGGQIVVEGELR